MENFQNVVMGVLAGSITAALMAITIVAIQTNKKLGFRKSKKK